MLKKELAFKCICTSQEIEMRRNDNLKKNLSIKKLCTTCEKNKKIQNLKKDYCIRIKISNEGKTSINDIVQGNVIVKNSEIDNFILIRKDGTPTYMLSVVVDDNDSNVNTIIRGDDHLNNTFRQIHIYNHLNWPIPKYAHLPLIHGADGSKLSKRHGAITIHEFKKNGYLPQSLINHLILLGWSPKKENEYINIDEIIKIFQIEKISKSSSIFDYDKLNHFNNFYLRKEENLDYFLQFSKNNKILKSFYEEDKEKFLKVFQIYKKNINFFKEIEIITNIYFNKKFKTEINNIFDENFNTVIKEFVYNIKSIKNGIWKI